MKDIAKLVNQNKLECIRLLKKKTHGSLEFTEEERPIVLTNFGKQNTEFYVEKVLLTRNIVTNKAEIAFLITEVESGEKYNTWFSTYDTAYHTENDIYEAVAEKLKTNHKP